MQRNGNIDDVYAYDADAYANDADAFGACSDDASADDDLS